MIKKSSIETANFKALKKRVEGGRPLSAAQMRFVESYSQRDKIVAANDSDSVATVVELSRQLGVNRQVINWHRGRADAPKSLSVGAWRGYLAEHGRGATVERVGQSSAPRRSKHVEAVEDCTLEQFTAISEVLPQAVGDALAAVGVKVSSVKLDRIVLLTWLLLAAAQQDSARRLGIEGVLDGYTTVEGKEMAAYPRVIRTIAARVDDAFEFSLRERPSDLIASVASAGETVEGASHQTAAQASL
jgi:hypothetical protein